MSDQTDSEQGGTAAAAGGENGSADLDFSNDAVSENQPPTPRVGGEYDPRPQEDGARRTIAYLLIGLLWVIVAGILILLSLGTIAVDDLKEFGFVLGPVVTLVSAATGFYYGTKSNLTRALPKQDAD